MRFIRRSRRRCPVILRLMALLSVASVVLLFAADAKMRPILSKLAHDEANYNVTNIMNKAFSETLSNQSISYGELVSVSRDSMGRVTSVEANPQTVNRIVTYTVNSIYEKISENITVRCGISIGSLTGLALLQSKGFEIPVVSQMSRYVNYKIISSFTDAGINQTLHSIYLSITSNMFTYIPGEKMNQTATVEFLLAQTVIVGDVPDAYTGVFQAYEEDVGFDDIEDTIMNYKAE